ncbi:hypothetical protein [Sphingobium sp. CFD-1]|uniref:hypothetical protein n=1 Tax=Sphingobium sp. CFD-1 TaxID=2878545 RepID=UPI00214B206A|nr:hypothetical protein [Sphingobium sp. CFD-1]
MARKQRVDSATAAVSVMVGAAKAELLPPGHSPLPDAAMPFWRAIVRGRAREEWEATPALLATAANLAWTQWQIVKIREAVEGDPVPDAKAVQRMSDMQRLEMAYLRTLQQHGRGAQGEARDVKNRREQTAGVTKDNPLDDDLIARPTVQ